VSVGLGRRVVALAAIAMWMGLSAGPAAADGAVPVTDLAVTAGPVTGSVGQLVAVLTTRSNEGPDTVQADAVYWDYVAPAGTELIGESALGATAPGPFVSDSCHWVAPKTHMLCYTLVNWAHVSGAPSIQHPGELWLKIDKRVTGPGSYSIHCLPNRCTDPNLSNNSTALVVHMDAPATGPSAPGPRPTATPATPFCGSCPQHRPGQGPPTVIILNMTRTASPVPAVARAAGTDSAGAVRMWLAITTAATVAAWAGVVLAVRRRWPRTRRIGRPPV